MTIEIPDKMYGNIKEYCELNGMDTYKYICDSLNRSLMIDKYGETPFHNAEQKNTEQIDVKQETTIDKKNEKVEIVKKENKTNVKKRILK